MSKLSSMVSFRADWEEYDWLHNFSIGCVSRTLYVLCHVARICLSSDEFRKWRFLSEEELKKKKLVLIDKGTAVCNTQSQG